MKLVFILATILVATVCSVPLEREIDGRLRVIHGVGEDGGPSRLENLYGNQMDEETEKNSQAAEQEEDKYILEDGTELSENEFHERFEKVPVTPQPQGAVEHKEEEKKHHGEEHEEEHHEHMMIHHGEKDAEKPPVEEEDDHEDGEGPLEEPTFEPEEKVLPEEQQRMDENKNTEMKREEEEEKHSEEKIEIESEKLGEVIPPWILEKMTEEERKKLMLEASGVEVETEDAEELDEGKFVETEDDHDERFGVELPHGAENEEEVETNSEEVHHGTEEEKEEAMLSMKNKIEREEEAAKREREETKHTENEEEKYDEEEYEGEENEEVTKEEQSYEETATTPTTIIMKDNEEEAVKHIDEEAKSGEH